MTSLNIAFFKIPNPQFMKPQGLIMVKMLCQSENKNKKSLNIPNLLKQLSCTIFFCFFNTSTSFYNNIVQLKLAWNTHQWPHLSFINKFGLPICTPCNRVRLLTSHIKKNVRASLVHYWYLMKKSSPKL